MQPQPTRKRILGLMVSKNGNNGNGHHPKTNLDILQTLHDAIDGQTNPEAETNYRLLCELQDQLECLKSEVLTELPPARAAYFHSRIESISAQSRQISMASGA